LKKRKTGIHLFTNHQMNFEESKLEETPI